jgi:hypothetical protein
MEPFFPPTPGQLRVISEDLREEIKKRQKDCQFWCGGTIPSNFKPYFADVDAQGHFKKVFFKEGDRREFFVVE